MTKKIESVKKSVEMLEEAGVGEKAVATLKSELARLETRDKKVKAFREIVLLGSNHLSSVQSWDYLPESDKEHYYAVMEKHEKFFTEWGLNDGDLSVGSKVQFGDDMPKHLKYKDTDGDTWFWESDSGSWCYKGVSSGQLRGHYAHFNNAESLFPMEVVS